MKLTAVVQGHGGIGNLEEHVSVPSATFISVGTEAKQPREVNIQLVLQAFKEPP